MPPVSRRTSGRDLLATQVRETIRRHGMLAGGERVVVAVSGGPDSTALLSVLAALREELRLDLHVAHLNHGLRPEAGCDAAAVAQTARALRCPYHEAAEDVAAAAARARRSIEDAGRDARYGFLAATARRIEAMVIATGHTRDDQAETVLMRLLRGSGPRGLAGIPPVRPHDGLRVIRPLIDTPRAEIVAYLAWRQLAAREDSSNRDLAALRNRVRLVLLPILEGYNPDVRRALARLADVMRDDADAFDALSAPEVDAVLRGTHASVRIAPDAFGRLPVALQRRALREAIRRVSGNGAPVAFVHIEEARLGVLGGRAGAVWEAPGGVRIFRRPDAIEVTAKGPATPDDARRGY
ncbi:MAG TPA: tRNA lysidine(34) synthetase TilS [bacterium]|nr:tRNA lysidine(34) synthetase TilS [bacterium]